MYIDCHIHLLPDKRRGKLIKWVRSFMPDHPTPPGASNEDAIADLRRNGAQRWVNLLYPIWPDESREINRFGADLAEKYPESITFGGVHVIDPDPMAVVKECIEDHGMSGIKFHPMVQRFSPADPKLMPIYPYLESKGCALYMHTGYDQWYGWTLPPDDVKKIVENHPGMGVVLSHLCFPNIGWAFDLARKNENLWLDTTNVWGSFAMMDKFDVDHPDKPEEPNALKSLFKEGISELRDRVIFGTDHPAGVGGIEDIYNDLAALELDEELVEQITLKSPMRFMELYERS